MNIKFELTENHIKLVLHFYIEENNEAYYGAPQVDIKRPYGNSDVYNDVARIIGIEPITTIDEDKVLTKEQGEIVKKIHKEMSTALQIILCTRSFIPGTYEQTSEYNTLSWKLVKE